jgi:hypothetical protein
VALTNVVVRVDLTLAVFTHCTTEHGKMFVPVTVNVSAELPAAAEVCESDAIVGATSGVAGVESVNGRDDEVPIEFVTVTATVPAKAGSEAGIAAVNCVALTNVVACRAPFQFTTASFVKFEPFTVSVKPCALQNGVDAAEVVDAEMEVIAGDVPAGALIVKRTTFDISVVAVLLMFCVADCADPGICTDTWAVPGVVRFDAGTGAVNCELLTSVVVRGVPFHRIRAPETKPAPLAVIVNPCAPAVAALGLTKLSMEVEVWIERFVL